MVLGMVLGMILEMVLGTLLETGEGTAKAIRMRSGWVIPDDMRQGWLR
jgi:hypothetical protein